MEDLSILAAIGAANGDTRNLGSAGYADSLDHVEQVLLPLGYELTREPLDVESFKEFTEPALEATTPTFEAFAPGEDFVTMQYSGAGDVTAPLTSVQPTLGELGLRRGRLRRVHPGARGAHPPRRMHLPHQGHQRRRPPGPPRSSSTTTRGGCSPPRWASTPT